jgi:cyanate permease
VREVQTRHRGQKLTAANAVYCALVHVLGLLFWSLNEMLQCSMVMIFKLQTIKPHTLARYLGRAQKAAYSGFSQAVKSEVFQRK